MLKKGSTGKFRFNLVATNGQVTATSEAYESKPSAIKGIESVKRNAPTPRSTTRPTSSLLVRAGSARQQKPLVPGGHERSTSANQHRRSQAVHRHLERRSNPALGSNPTCTSALAGFFCWLAWKSARPLRRATL